MSSPLNNPILIFDGMNFAIRHYCANPSMNAEAQPVGMIVGFLNGMAKLCSMLTPNRVIIAWEGEGGSSKRRKLLPEYKENRRPPKLNRFYERDDMPIDSNENRLWQNVQLVELLASLPVTQVYVKDCEADDVIAAMCRGPLRSENCVIVTSDKDYYQLLDESKAMYTPSKKLFVMQQHVLQEYGIHPTNFALAKAVCGDGSDNVKGVNGLGFKTLAKRIPELAEAKKLDIDELVSMCAERSKRATDLMARVVESQDLIETNYKVVDLSESWMMDAHQQSRVQGALDTQRSKPNKMAMLRKLTELGISNGVDVIGLFQSMKHITAK